MSIEDKYTLIGMIALILIQHLMVSVSHEYRFSVGEEAMLGAVFLALIALFILRPELVWTL